MRSFLMSRQPRWQIALEMLAFGFILAIVCGSALIYIGAYDVAATRHHWSVTEWVLDTARIRSIKARAAGITPPPGLDDKAKVLTGTEHFADHCAVCHGAPGVPKGEIAEGLYPQPPNLAVASKHFTDAELFWIVKHGIKMTGMPGWSNHSDEEIWATVAFIRELVEMSPQDYAKFIAASRAQGGHHHDVQEPRPAPAPQPAGRDHEHPAGHD